MTDTDTEFQGWVILELMDHQRLGGYLKAEAIAGFSFLRIDVYGTNGEAILTQFYPPNAVYCLTPTTEEIAKAFGDRHQPQPVTRFDLPQMKVPSMAEVYGGNEDDDDYYESSTVG